jgi:hypothetical protein
LVKNEPVWDSEEGINMRKDYGIYDDEQLEDQDTTV